MLLIEKGKNCRVLQEQLQLSPRRVTAQRSHALRDTRDLYIFTDMDWDPAFSYRSP